MLKKLLYTPIKNFRISQKLDQRSIALLYHEVDYERYLTKKHVNAHYVDLEAFVKQLKAIGKKKTFVSDEEFISLTTYGSKDHVVCLTFDDGYLSTWLSAIPLLEDLKIPSTFYVNSSLVSGENFWRNQVRTVIAHKLQREFIDFSGMQKEVRAENFYVDTKDPQRVSSKIIKESLDAFLKIKLIYVDEDRRLCDLTELKKVENHQYVKLGNHSKSHFILSTLSADEQLSDIKACKEFLSANITEKKISRVFSMPFGAENTYNDKTITVLEKLGFTGAFVSEAGEYISGKPLLQFKNGFPLYKRFLPKQYLRL